MSDQNEPTALGAEPHEPQAGTIEAAPQVLPPPKQHGEDDERLTPVPPPHPH